MRRVTAFTTRWHARPAKIQISARILAVRSVSQGTLWVAKDLQRYQADSEESDQHVRLSLRWMRMKSCRKCAPAQICSTESQL